MVTYMTISFISLVFESILHLKQGTFFPVPVFAPVHNDRSIIIIFLFNGFLWGGGGHCAKTDKGFRLQNRALTFVALTEYVYTLT